MRRISRSELVVTKPESGWVDPLLDFRRNETVAGWSHVLPEACSRGCQQVARRPLFTVFLLSQSLLESCSNSLTINHVRVFRRQCYDAGNGVRIPVLFEMTTYEYGIPD